MEQCKKILLEEFGTVKNEEDVDMQQIILREFKDKEQKRLDDIKFWNEVVKPEHGIAEVDSEVKIEDTNK